MNTFKRKALFTAVVAGLGVARYAQAVYLSPNGTAPGSGVPVLHGSVGRRQRVQHLHLRRQHDDIAKVVKVRFREGKTSPEVLDFNLYLSPNDVWTGAIIPAGTTPLPLPAASSRADASCTNPAIPATGVDFRNFQYVRRARCAAGTGLERTREGYVEMIEMGTLNAGRDPPLPSHDAAGVPPTAPRLRARSSRFAGQITRPRAA